MASRASIATWALVRDTFREAFARKIFWGFFGCSSMVILFFLFLMKVDVVEGALATVSLFGNELPARDVMRLVHEVQGGLAAFLFLGLVDDLLGQRDDLIAFLRSLTDESLLHDRRFSNPWKTGSSAH